MIRKKIRLPFLFLLVTSALQAQVQNNPPMHQVLATAGGSGTFPAGTIDYTIGESIVTTYASGISSLVKFVTQGFQQPVTAIDTTRIINPLKFYTGITPNGDGENDIWEIEGITKFPDNSVSLFNRWGNKVWNKNNYDNVTIVWDGKNNTGELLPDATYFYVLEADGKTYKGWIELTK